jgi:hypothetical protein
MQPNQGRSVARRLNWETCANASPVVQLGNPHTAALIRGMLWIWVLVGAWLSLGYANEVTEGWAAERGLP